MPQRHGFLVLVPVQVLLRWAVWSAAAQIFVHPFQGVNASWGSGWDQSFFVSGRSRRRSRSGWNFFINLCSASLSSVTTVFWQTVPAAMATKTPASPFPELRRFESGEGAVITLPFFAMLRFSLRKLQDHFSTASPARFIRISPLDKVTGANPPVLLTDT